METSKISEAIHYVSMLWNMQEQDIRDKCVLDVDALRMTNEKQQLFAEAQEQLEAARNFIDVFEDRDKFLSLAVRTVIEAHERGEIPTFNDQNLRSWLSTKES